MWLSTRADGGCGQETPANSVPKLWVHKEGHFQMHKYEKWEVWEEWKHKGAIHWAGEGRTAGSGGQIVRREPLDRDTAGHRAATESA